MSSEKSMLLLGLRKMASPSARPRASPLDDGIAQVDWINVSLFEASTRLPRRESPHTADPEPPGVVRRQRGELQPAATMSKVRNREANRRPDRGTCQHVAQVVAVRRHTQIVAPHGQGEA